MLSTPSAVVLWWFRMTSGKLGIRPIREEVLTNGANRCGNRLLDKIARDIMVCENKTVRRWDGSIGEYKNYLRKKMLSMGQV